jgi:hypothetical protein
MDRDEYKYGCTIGKKDGSYNPSTGTTIKWRGVVTAEFDDIENLVANYYEVLGIDENEVKVLQMFNDSVSEYISVGAGLGGGFTNINELRMMKYHEVQTAKIESRSQNRTWKNGKKW